MKKTIFHIVLLIVTVSFLSQPANGQTSEPAESTTTDKNLQPVDDLAPYPFEKKVPEKKTLGQKIKGSFEAGEKSEPTPPPTSETEEYIRFYEFEDITFSSDGVGDGNENDEVGPMDNYTTTEDVYTYKKEYYKDVTFAEEEWKESNIDEPENKSIFSGQEQQNAITDAGSPTVAKPIVLKDKDYYRQDYINYYYHRKKKGNGTPGNPPSFSEEIKNSKKRIWDRIDKNRSERQ